MLWASPRKNGLLGPEDTARLGRSGQVLSKARPCEGTAGRFKQLPRHPITTRHGATRDRNVSKWRGRLTVMTLTHVASYSEK